MQLTITKIGTSSGIVLPKAALRQLNAKQGQKVYLTEAPGGGLMLSRYDPEFEEQMRCAYEAMDQYPDALKELAK
jgi:putative addiction module antidote